MFNKNFFADLLNYIPSFVMLIFSMVALHFSIVLIDGYGGAIEFEEHGDHFHVSSLDNEGFVEYENQSARAGHNLYWAVIAIGLAGFVLVLVNNDQYRKIRKAQKQREKAQEEHAELQSQLHQAQKMEAIGRLAGGVAHDFNNILAAMNGYAEFLIEDLEEDTDQHKFAGNILQAGKQARLLVDQIMAFSRRQDGEFENIDLVHSVNESMAMLSASLPKTIELQTDIDIDTVLVSANATQISQVLMNLCVNAKDAMEDEHGILKLGLKRIESCNYADMGLVCKSVDSKDSDIIPIKIEDVGTKTARLLLGMLEEEQSYVCLSISDTGTGMSKSIMEHIFEPFFTTKPVDKGTGLGLATVHGVIAGHSGAMIINSTLDSGTNFELFFPISEDQAVPQTENVYVRSVVAQSNILIVEDQDHVRDMMINMLERMGHTPRTSVNGLDALDFLRENIGDIDLVITDQNMPKMTGLELIAEASEDFPDLPFILLSGYSEKKLEPLIKGHMSIKATLKKPVSRDVLEQTITDILLVKRDNKKVASG